jgi:hypothetical protein
MIDQLTIRRIDDSLELELRALARAEDLSLNQAAIKLLRKGAGLAIEKPERAVIGDAFDWIIGSLSAAEGQKLDEELKAFSAIDERLWR